MLLLPSSVFYKSMELKREQDIIRVILIAATAIAIATAITPHLTTMDARPTTLSTIKKSTTNVAVPQLLLDC